MTGMKRAANTELAMPDMLRRFWVQVLLFLLAGAVSALALPPIGWWPVLGLTFSGILWIWDRSGPQRWHSDGLLGFSFGFGYFVVALHWIGVAFFVNADDYLWMMPFAVGGLAVFLALYWGLAFLLARWLSHSKRRLPVPAFLALPFALALMEIMRGVLFTGFPWAAPGLVAEGMGGVLQFASIIGMWGLSFLVLLWAALPFALVQYWRAGLGPCIFVWLLIASLPVCWGWGEIRLRANPTSATADVRLRLVQPNLPQDDKWRDAHARQIFEGLLAQSAQSTSKPPTHIIWPESSVPFLLDESPGALRAIGQMLGPNRILMAGSIRREPRTKDTSDQPYFTSVEVIDGSGTIVGVYDKWRLVPGGEFLPLAWLLEPLGFRKVVNLPEGFSAGPGPHSLEVPGAGLAGFLICYEAVFPDRLIQKGERPQWIINVTNDGWFGTSVGPWQHLAQVRMRSVEQGLPIARAANTGISAIFDPLGRIVAASRMSEKTVVDGILPKPLPATLFARFGIFASLSLMLLLVVVGSMLTWRNR